MPDPARSPLPAPGGPFGRRLRQGHPLPRSRAAAPRPIRHPHSAAGLLLLALICAAPGRAQEVTNDYPTAARADYVFGCMATNGETQDALDRCSCSIDAIAEVLPYDRYVAAETVLRMRQVPGERSAIFRGTAPTTEAVADLRRAQAEAEILCF